MLVSTFLGKIPAPMIYGFLVDKYEKDNYSLPWKICLCYFFFGALLAFILCIFRMLRNFDPLQNICQGGKDPFYMVI